MSNSRNLEGELLHDDQDECLQEQDVRHVLHERSENCADAGLIWNWSFYHLSFDKYFRSQVTPRFASLQQFINSILFCIHQDRPLLRKVTNGMETCIKTWGQYHQSSMSSFYTHRSQKRKKDSQVAGLFYIFGICACKSCSKNIDEIDPCQV